MATLAQLRIRARRRANMEDAGSDQFVTDGELDAYINDGLSELYDLLITCWGEDYFIAQSTVNVVSGTASYALPADFYKLALVTITDGSSVRDVPRFRVHDIAALDQIGVNGGASSIYQLHYGLNSHVDDQITFLPTPQAAYTATLYYIPTFTLLADPTADSSTTDINRWDEYAVLSAAIKMATKEESFELATLLGGELARIEQRVRNLAGSRDAGRPHQIQDTRRDYADWPYSSETYDGRRYD